MAESGAGQNAGEEAARAGGLPGARARGDALVELLGREAGTLLPAEERLARAVALGEFCDAATEAGDERLTAESEPDAWKKWGEHRTVRAEVLRAICTRREAHALADTRGIQLLNAAVKGALDLEGAVVPFDIWLHGCAFEQTIIALGARVRTLSLQGSHVPGLTADRLEAGGGVFLRKGFRSRGEVRLLGARIAGNLDCSGGWFHNEDGYALNADRLEPGGGVFLGGGFQSRGEVRLVGARIAGDLDCDGGRFHNEKTRALSADRLEAKGSVFLRNGFESYGEVRLLGARIAGDLSCVGGRFHNKKENGKALSADGATIDGTLFLRDGEFDGEVDLTGSRIGYLHDTPAGWDGRGRPKWPERVLLGDCRYDALHAGSPLDARSRLAWLANHDQTFNDQTFNDLTFNDKTDEDKTVKKHRPPLLPPDPQPYRWLAGVLRRQGHERDADKVMRSLGWRRMMPLFRQRFRGGPVSCSFVGLMLAAWNRAIAVVYLVFSFFYGVFVGHGYARWLPLLWLLGFWGLGCLVFGAYGARHMQPTQSVALRAWGEAVQGGWTPTPGRPGDLLVWLAADPGRAEGLAGQDPRWVARYPGFNAAVYSIDAFLPLVDFHQEEYWTPGSGARWSWAWFVKTIYLPFHIISGWIVATLFAASFTRLARQE